MVSRLLRAIILGILTGMLGLVLSLLPFGLDYEEDVGLDLLFKLRGEKRPPSDVVVVSIDKESCETLNLPDNPDKWPRSVHARLIENLAKEGAKVIAFDVHFIEPRSRKTTFSSQRQSVTLGTACFVNRSKQRRSPRPTKLALLRMVTAL